MSDTTYSPEVVAARGKEWWRTLQPALEVGNKGKYVVINVETGDYELAEDQLQASQRATAKYPGHLLYGMRIGYRATGRIGFAPRSRVR
jgi:hypothetical protein